MTMDEIEEGYSMINLLWAFHDMDVNKYPLEEAYFMWDGEASFRNEIRSQYRQMISLVATAKKVGKEYIFKGN